MGSHASWGLWSLTLLFLANLDGTQVSKLAFMCVNLPLEWAYPALKPWCVFGAGCLHQRLRLPTGCQRRHVRAGTVACKLTRHTMRCNSLREGISLLSPPCPQIPVVRGRRSLAQCFLPVRMGDALGGFAISTCTDVHANSPSRAHVFQLVSPPCFVAGPWATPRQVPIDGQLWMC